VTLRSHISGNQLSAKLFTRLKRRQRVHTFGTSDLSIGEYEPLLNFDVNGLFWDCENVAREFKPQTDKEPCLLSFCELLRDAPMRHSGCAAAGRSCYHKLRWPLLMFDAGHINLWDPIRNLSPKRARLCESVFEPDKWQFQSYSACVRLQRCQLKTTVLVNIKPDLRPNIQAINQFLCDFWARVNTAQYPNRKRIVPYRGHQNWRTYWTTTQTGRVPVGAL
jgi:hypothetical protein